MRLTSSVKLTIRLRGRSITITQTAGVDMIACRVCQNPNCDNIFVVAKNKQGQIYCSSQCSMRMRKNKRKVKSKSGVYVIRAVGTNLYKIGSTSNIQMRMLGMATDCPYPIELVCLIKTNQSLEKELHRIYIEYHFHGEWYTLQQHHIESLQYIAQHTIIA